MQLAERLDGDAHQRAAGADLVHVTGKTGHGHDHQTKACGGTAEGIAHELEDVEPLETGAFAARQDVCRTQQDCRGHEHDAAKKKHRLGLVVLEHHVPHRGGNEKRDKQCHCLTSKSQDCEICRFTPCAQPQDRACGRPMAVFVFLQIYHTEKYFPVLRKGYSPSSHRAPPLPEHRIFFKPKCTAARATGMRGPPGGRARQSLPQPSQARGKRKSGNAEVEIEAEPR